MVTIGPHNQQIPIPPTSLVGRDDDLARLGDLLARPDVRLVTLMGTGGVGKTRLALQFGQDVDPVVIGEPHLVLLANARDDEAVLAAIARSLGVSQVGAVPLETLLADAIGTQKVLLILDNLEQVADQLAFLPGLIAACPRLRVLATSRTMLRFSAEHVFPVEPLATGSAGAKSAAPAAMLFIERARAVRPDLELTPENLAAIDDVCRQIDGLPLAIELAAARTRFISPVALRDRLTERLTLLVGGPRDAPERHRTLRATLAWSHDLLSTEERVLFRRLAVFEPGGPLAAVDPVCNASGDLGGNVEEILAALADHSLVRLYDQPATGPRVRLLNTIREFAQEQLQVSGEEEAVRKAHAAWFAGHVIGTPVETWRTGSELLETWTARNLPDVDNFSVTIKRLLEHGENASAFQVVRQLVPFWLEIGQLRESGMWTQRVMPFVDAAKLDEQAHFYRMAAAMAMKDNNFDEADVHAARALALAEQTGASRLLANSQNLLGQIRWRRGFAEEGERLQRAAIATAAAMGDPLGGALFAAQIADALVEAGELDRAEPILREAIPVVARERPGALPFLQGAMGYLLMQRGQLDEASEQLERSLDYHIQPPHRLPSLLAGRLLTIADLAVRRNAPDRAARLLVGSLGLCQRIGITVDQQSRDEVKRIGLQACAALGEEVLEREMAAGKRYSTPALIDLALEVTRLRSTAGETAPAAANPASDLLTPREQEVLALLVEGKSNGAIAEALYISERTVTTHLSRLYTKLEVSTRSEAIARAMRTGLAGVNGAHT